MRLSAIESLRHGLLNVRANWQLVLVQLAQTLLVMVLTLIGLVPIFMVLGFTFVKGALDRFGAGGETELIESVMSGGAPLIVALLITTLIWTVAFIVYCYIQGGLLGVLATGERQAAGGEARWPAFQAFSMKSFFERAERYTWPVFWLINLFLALGLAVLMVFMLAAAFFMTGLIGEGLTGGFESLGELGAGILLFGCFGVLLMVLITVFFSLWMQVALAELVTGASGVLGAARAGLATFGRRLPGLLLLFLLLIVASIAMAIVFLPLSLMLEVAMREGMSTYLVGQAFLSLLQWLATGVINLGWAGTAIALVYGEHERAT